MPNHLQYGLLPCNLQGGVNHETAARVPYLVRINRVFNAVDIHISYPVSPVRDQVKGRKQGGRSKPGLRIQR
ncbi:modulator of post-segregation killing protein [Salmonella enterica subsp. enterica serovar Muenchen str. baa1594]|nr:modulator of post-segregation killing protein [Salmonella enterica subsp. enterica serovar Muenchen str. baa1594]